MLAFQLGVRDTAAVEIDVIRPQFMPREMIARWRELQSLEKAWDSPFLSPSWPRAVERAQEGMDPGIRVLVLHEGGRSCGFMAVRAGAVTAMAAGAPMCDYQGLVTEPGVTIDPKRLAPALGIHRLDFAHMLESQSAFAPYVKGRADSWIVDLPEGYAAYAAERREAGVTTFKDLDKKKRKVEREVGPVTFTARSTSRADLERLIELKRAQHVATGQTDIFAASWPVRLVQNLFATREADFGGALFTLHIGEELAAAQFHIMGERTVHAWLIAHDEAYERYSPGLLLFQQILKWMDDEPYDRLDLGYGDYRFKRDLSNAKQGVVHGFVGIPSPASFMRGAAYRFRQMAETLPLGAVSELPGKAMRRVDMLRGLR
ncbi:MAG: GNAT family N-acetyltransferase [Caulobacterales bacterium]